MSLRIGADIGGTFTDIILIDDDGGIFQVGKVLTTPDQPDDAVLTGVEKVIGETGTDPGRVSHVVHGTTLFTRIKKINNGRLNPPMGLIPDR